MRIFRGKAYVKAVNTIKRKADEGEQIIIVKPCHTGDFTKYKIGQRYTVKDVYTASIYTTTGLGLWDWEYKVIF